jgi:hypothetical protein
MPRDDQGSYWGRGMRTGPKIGSADHGGRPRRGAGPAARRVGIVVRCLTAPLGAARWVLVPIGADAANGQHCAITTEARREP